MSSSVDDIKEQEEDIFQELGSYDFQNELQFQRATRGNPTRDKALEQLAVSVDSPFSRSLKSGDELRQQREARAAALKEETDEIRRQLDAVKSRLSEMRIMKESERKFSPKPLQNENIAQETDKRVGHSLGYRLDDDAENMVKSNFKTLSINNNRPINAKTTKFDLKKKAIEPRYRPLTGKADCPNCACDRRSSVCNLCMDLVTRSAKQNSTFASDRSHLSDESKRIERNHHQEDNRPIRPAQGFRAIATVENVDDKVVPGKVYAISRSLDEKRTKLAQAIDELQLMTNQVKAKGDKLERERKLVQLYKDQWKFGPSIGGPSASSRERLGTAQQKRNYESHLDPNLARDSKSVAGFRHIESAMKLRQPVAAERRLNRKPSNQTTHSRSKSLESLRPTTRSESKLQTNTNLQKAIANFHNGKASSEVDLVAPATTVRGSLEDESQPARACDEDDDNGEVVEEIANGSAVAIASEKDVEDPAGGNTKDSGGATAESGGKVQRMTWIPVFGETEIKTIKRVPKRKVQIVGTRTTAATREENSAIKTGGLSRSTSNLGARRTADNNLASYRTNSKSNLSNRGTDRILTDANRKLRFASDLLEQEHQDSHSRNQLLVRKPVPRPRKLAVASPLSSSLPVSSASNNVENMRSPVANQTLAKNPATSKEIARLEEMVIEQQRLLSRLTELQDQRPQLVSPVTVSCSSPCCLHTTMPLKASPTRGSSTNRLATPGSGKSSSLVHILKERLNKTKLRLARTLEEEREKHQQLKQRVDSSLRKQSDLENENQLLKQSLSKCIDTCLKDISSTFESLNETLTDSIDNGAVNKQSANDDDEIQSVDSGSILTNAARLIADNRHLKQMKSHVETIEYQRKGIFQELNREKQRSNQLEAQLRDSQAELNRLSLAKQELESQLARASGGQASGSNISGKEIPAGQHLSDSQSSNSIVTVSNQPSTDKTQTDTTDRSDMEDSNGSFEVYRQYIQSISPDIESIKRDRRLILSEFDSIKKMLSEIDK